MDSSGRIFQMGKNETPPKDAVIISNRLAEFFGDKSITVRKNWMKNQSCPCKSGLKFKKCCWSKFSPKKMS